MCNDPFWLTREEAGNLTDHQAIEWYIKRYPVEVDKKVAEEFDTSVQAELRRREEEDQKKTLAQRKAEYWAFSTEFGCSEAAIQAAWDEQMKGG